MTPMAITAPELPKWRKRLEWHFGEMCASGQFTPDDLAQQIERRERQLWVALDGEEVRCAVLTMVQADRLSTVTVTHCVGAGYRDWLHMWPVLEGWAREMGSQRIEALARPGWERVLTGMRKTHVLLEKRL